MASTQSLRIQNDKFASLGLVKTVSDQDQVVSYSRFSKAAVSEKNPILVFIHGYPQSSYMWRHIIPHISEDVTIFAPDLPGYGGSAPIQSNDKLSVGNAVLAALKSNAKEHNFVSSSGSIPVVLIGHDRGARVAHRLAVSGYDGIDILGVCLIDIVPTCTQWHHSSSPSKTAKEVTGYFHWPLLANVGLATRMITAYGGSNWCTEMIERWAGKNPSGLESLKADDALAVYGGFFQKEEVIRASCEDYKHGATTDLEAQEKDQEEGRKIKAPLLLLYSQDFIGSRFDFSTVWKEWVNEGVNIQHHGLKDGIGHFGAEEAPRQCADVIVKWLKRLREGSGARL